MDDRPTVSPSTGSAWQRDERRHLGAAAGGPPSGCLGVLRTLFRKLSTSQGVRNCTHLTELTLEGDATSHDTERGCQPGLGPLSLWAADNAGSRGSLARRSGNRERVAVRDVATTWRFLPPRSGTSARDLARRDRGRTGVPWCRSASVASGTRIVAFRNCGPSRSASCPPPGSQPYGDSDYARDDEPRPQRPEIARPDERQRLTKGYHDEDPRALGESLAGIHAHTYCLAWLPDQRDSLIGTPTAPVNSAATGSCEPDRPAPRCGQRPAAMPAINAGMTTPTKSALTTAAAIFFVSPAGSMATTAATPPSAMLNTSTRPQPIHAVSEERSIAEAATSPRRDGTSRKPGQGADVPP